MISISFNLMEERTILSSKEVLAFLNYLSMINHYKRNKCHMNIKQRSVIWIFVTTWLQINLINN